MTYQEGKAFLKDAELVTEGRTDTHIWRTWRKPDGSEWHENESRLEAPEDDYELRRAPGPPRLHCDMLGIWAERGRP